MSKIIALVGMNGTGKTTAAKILENKGYKVISFGDVTYDRLREKNLEVTPENEKMMCEKLREDLGMGAFALILLPKIKDAIKEGNVVLDGLYSWDEYKILDGEFDKKMTTIAIVTDKKLRYKRLETASKPMTKKEAMVRDLNEIDNVDKAPPIAYADYYILNNFDENELRQKLTKILLEL